MYVALWGQLVFNRGNSIKRTFPFYFHICKTFVEKIKFEVEFQ